MKKIFFLFILLLLSKSCKQDSSNLLLESSLPDLENYNTLEKEDFFLTKNGKSTDGFKKGIWKYQINKKTKNVFWNVHEDKFIKINYLNSWKINEENDYLFYSIIDQKKEDFFLIKRYEKDEIGFDLESYLRTAVSTASRLENQKITNSIIVKYNYPNRTVYYFRFDTRKKNKDISYYVFYTEDENFIYDATMKKIGKGSILDKEIFAGVVYSIEIEKRKLFGSSEESFSTKIYEIEDFY